MFLTGLSERQAARVNCRLLLPPHPRPVDGDVNLLWPRRCLDGSLCIPCLSSASLCGTRWAKRGVTPCGGSCHQFLAPFEDHEIADPRRTISALSLLTGERLTRDYNVTGMSQSVWLSLWVYTHPVAQCTQEGTIWSIKRTLLSPLSLVSPF